MCLPPPEFDIEQFKEKETWKVRNILTLLFGPINRAEEKSIFQGITPSHKQFSQKLFQAGEKGRFGNVLGESDYLWGIPTEGDFDLYFEEAQMGTYQDYVGHVVEGMLRVEIHALRVVDWIQDENILELLPEGAPLSQINEVLAHWEGKRENVPGVPHAVDLQDFARANFWVKTEIQVLLFGQTHSDRYFPQDYLRYQPKIESCLDELDAFLEAGILTKELSTYSLKKGARQRLIEEGDDVEVSRSDDQREYFGIYEWDELNNTGGTLLIPPEVLRFLSNKGYPVPEDLPIILETGKWKQAVALLQSLRTDMKSYVEHGIVETPEFAPRDLPEKAKQLLPAPEGTVWGQVGFAVSATGSIQIKIGGSREDFSIEEFKQIFPQVKSRNMLLKLIHYSGVLGKDNLEGNQQKNIKQYMSALRKELMNVFGIQDNPIVPDLQGSYRSQFSATSELVAPEED